MKTELKKLNHFQKNKRNILLQFAIVSIIVILLNIIGTKWHAKLDLTDDHKFTLSKPTKVMLANLKDVVNIRVLMTGKLPSNYTKLVQGTTDVLKAFQEASKGKVQFIFENPIDGKTVEEKLKISEELKKQGIMPKQLKNQMEEGDGIEQRFIFPYAQIMANGTGNNICLREEHYGMDEDGILNYSENMLEYKFANSIKQLHQVSKPQIAYVVGNGQMLNLNTLHALYLLDQQYDLDTIDINKGIEISSMYKAIVICKPTMPFDNKAKFKLDQYVMNGGKILWYLDAVNCSLDTMQKAPTYTAIAYDLNLDDMLLKYGVRLNTNLVEDMQCNEIPLTVGMVGNAPDIRPEPWVYFPIHIPNSTHPIVNNLDAVNGRFESTLDTIPNQDNKKTVLLATSQYSRELSAPLTVSFNSVRFKPKTSMFNKKYMPVAVVLEGGFSSFLENRINQSLIDIYQDSLGKKLKMHTDLPNKMIVISDGDMMLNDFSKTKGPAEMGYYTPTGKLFANKTLLLNCLEYLTEESPLLEARGKSVELRMLDKKRVKENKGVIQFLNIALPILIVILLGIAYFFFRKKKYEKPFSTLS
jgi:ABC-2 type transport system permease protein